MGILGVLVKNKLYHLLHFLLNAIGIIPWLLGVFMFFITTNIAILGHKLLPDADKGNCWSFALPRWYLSGGYLVIRWSKSREKIFGMRIPHVIWVSDGIQNTELQQTIPLNLTTKKILPPVFYFKYKVVTTETKQRN